MSIFFLCFPWPACFPCRIEFNLKCDNILKLESVQLSIVVILLWPHLVQVFSWFLCQLNDNDDDNDDDDDDKNDRMVEMTKL